MNLPYLSQSKAQKILLGFVTLFFVILYFPYLKHDPLLKRDDYALVVPLKKIHGFTEYLHAVKNNDVQDVQPLRDLSFYLNIKVEDWTGVKTFHLTNLLLMIFCTYLLFHIFSRLKWSTGEIITGVLLFSCHPILVSAMGWVSTRKHILGLMFILLSLNDILRKERLSKNSVVYFLASILSHQIFILFPVWVYFFLKQRKFLFSRSLFVTMCFAGVFVFGLSYYKTFSLEMGNATYNYFSTSENIARFILSSGRAAIILMFPNVISHSYYQGSIYNLIGIGLLVLYLYLIYKSPQRKECLLWIALALTTLLPTYIAFVNDTYLYLPLICFLISVVTLVRPYASRGLISFSVLVIALLSTKTISSSRMWMSDLDLWRYSYEQEKAPQAAMYFGKQLLTYNPKLALEFIHTGAKDYDLIADGYMLIFFVTTIYQADLPLDKKLEIFEDCYLDHEIYKGMYGLVLLEGNQTQEAKGLAFLKKIIKPDSSYKQDTIGMIFVNSIQKLCMSSHEKTYICKELGIRY